MQGIYIIIYPNAKEDNHYERINKKVAIQDAEVNNDEENDDEENDDEENDDEENDDEDGYGERTSPKQPKFNKKYIWIVNFINKVIKERIPDRARLVKKEYQQENSTAWSLYLEK